MRRLPPVRPSCGGWTVLTPWTRRRGGPAAGVTCVVTGPGSANAIGGQMVALKTRGTIADQMTPAPRRP